MARTTHRVPYGTISADASRLQPEATDFAAEVTVKGISAPFVMAATVSKWDPDLSGREVHFRVPGGMQAAIRDWYRKNRPAEKWDATEAGETLKEDLDTLIDIVWEAQGCPEPSERESGREVEGAPYFTRVVGWANSRKAKPPATPDATNETDPRNILRAAKGFDVD